VRKVLLQDGTVWLRNGCIFKCTLHRGDPCIPLCKSNGVWSVAHAQPWVSFAFAVGGRSAKVLNQELGLIANGFVEVNRKDRAKQWIAFDAAVKRARNTPESIGTQPPVERVWMQLCTRLARR